MTMIISKYRKKLRHIFLKKIYEKTGWGKKEIEKAFIESMEEVAIELLEEGER